MWQYNGPWQIDMDIVLASCSDAREKNITLLGPEFMSILQKDSGWSCLGAVPVSGPVMLLT